MVQRAPATPSFMTQPLRLPLTRRELPTVHPPAISTQGIGSTEMVEQQKAVGYEVQKVDRTLLRPSPTGPVEFHHALDLGERPLQIVGPVRVRCTDEVITRPLSKGIGRRWLVDVKLTEYPVISFPLRCGRDDRTVKELGARATPWLSSMWR